VDSVASRSEASTTCTSIFGPWAARVQRRLAWRFEDDGSLSGTFRLPPLQGAVLLKALRAAAAEPGQDGGVSAETPAEPVVRTSSSLADALLVVAEAYLAGKVATAEDAEVYQVMVHVGTDALTAGAEPGDVSAETPAPVPGDPADPGRCHVEDGPAVSVSTAQMIGCTAVLSWMRHDRDGAILALGRRRRRPNAAQRRAARERDKGRCRFPGCESRRTDLHHVVHWANGGRTDLANLISLCRYHHTVVHDRGYLIAARPGTEFEFYRPDGTLVPACPPLPAPDGQIGDCHDAEISPDTIIPPWYGERLDLDHAIYVCFANARSEHERRQKKDQATEPEARRVTVYKREDWPERIRQYYAETDGQPRRPVLIPVQV
jgi:HNH endonuclease/Domain of unknown function (DUF222)